MAIYTPIVICSIIKSTDYGLYTIKTTIVAALLSDKFHARTQPVSINFLLSKIRITNPKDGWTGR